MKKLLLVVAVVAIGALMAGLSSVYGASAEAPVRPVDGGSLSASGLGAPESDSSGKTFICHITGEDFRADGVERWIGHVLHVSDNAVAAHCSHGVGDHNPVLVNQGKGNFCARPKFFTNPTCEIGGVSGS